MFRSTSKIALFALTASACANQTVEISEDDDLASTDGETYDEENTTGTGKEPLSGTTGDETGGRHEASESTTGEESDGDTETRDDGGGDRPAVDDLFEGDLSLWEVLNPHGVHLAIADGFLRLEPAAHTVWYHDAIGPLVWQPVEGDFIATADVTSRRISNPDQPPSPQYRTGGLIARSPQGEAENYVFIAVGAEEFAEAVEVKTTLDSVSSYHATAWPGAEGELRICRIGRHFELLIRSRDGTWQSLVTYDRPDLPQLLQVGPFGFAAQHDPDLRVSFDWVRFRRPSHSSDCAD